MPILDDLKPRRKLLVMDLLDEAGFDVGAWKDYGGVPAANPKYCYNWSFEQPGERVAVCVWHRSLKPQGRTVIHRSRRKHYGSHAGTRSAAVWNRRARAFDQALEIAHRQQLPVNVIVVVVDGEQRDPSSNKASQVRARLLDTLEWAVTKYDEETGERLLVRGAKPVTPAISSVDLELSWFEGKERRKFTFHRQREGRARRAKIKNALAGNDGRLICEVENCGFDFKACYGDLGEGYAQVHHLLPLSSSPIDGREIKLSDLAIVCANCHVMIHVGGKCRPLKGLIRLTRGL
jgi:5-methylcytosine-specific restriction protein A